jgi:hypothetical protein
MNILLLWISRTPWSYCCVHGSMIETREDSVMNTRLLVLHQSSNFDKLYKKRNRKPSSTLAVIKKEPAAPADSPSITPAVFQIQPNLFPRSLSRQKISMIYPHIWGSINDKYRSTLKSLQACVCMVWYIQPGVQQQPFTIGSPRPSVQLHHLSLSSAKIVSKRYS